jgi:hypothetical protein
MVLNQELLCVVTNSRPDVTYVAHIGKTVIIPALRQAVQLESQEPPQYHIRCVLHLDTDVLYWVLKGGVSSQ